AAVSDGSDTGAQAFRRPETCDRDVLLPADPALALGVQPDPLREIGERIAETGIDRVLELGVCVDETRQDRRLVEARSRSELGARADRGDAAVLDGDCTLLDRWALDRQDPVGGEDRVHGSVRLA